MERAEQGGRAGSGHEGWRHGGGGMGEGMGGMGDSESTVSLLTVLGDCCMAVMNLAQWAWLQDRSASKRKRLTFSRQHVVVVGVHEHVTHDNHTFKKALFKLSKPQAQVAQARKPRTPCAFEAGPVQIHAKQQGRTHWDRIGLVTECGRFEHVCKGPQQAVQVEKKGLVLLPAVLQDDRSWLRILQERSLGRRKRQCHGFQRAMPAFHAGETASSKLGYC